MHQMAPPFHNDMWATPGFHAARLATGKVFGNPTTSYWLPLWLGWWHVSRWQIRASGGWGLSAHRPTRPGRRDA